MKRLALILAVLFFVVGLTGCTTKIVKDSYYYYYKEKIPIYVSEKFLVVQIIPNEWIETIAYVKDLEMRHKVLRATDLPNNAVLFKLCDSKTDQQDLERIINQVRLRKYVRYAGPVYYSTAKGSDVPELIPLDEISVKFKTGVEEEETKKVLNQYDLEIVKDDIGIGHLLRVKNPNKINAVEMAKKLIESDESFKIEYAEPNFIMLMEEYK